MQQSWRWAVKAQMWMCGAWTAAWEGNAWTQQRHVVCQVHVAQAYAYWSLVTGGPLHGLRRSICRQALACSCLAVRTLLQSAGLACRTHQGVKSIGMPHRQHDRRRVFLQPSPADGCCALQVLSGMKSSVFCLVLPGDSQSSRWTSQVVMSGCVPVFVGPPYASMPFPIDFGYGFASLVFNITDTR